MTNVCTSFNGLSAYDCVLPRKYLYIHEDDHVFVCMRYTARASVHIRMKTIGSYKNDL